MTRVDGYLSRKIQTIYPEGLVFCDSTGPVEVWTATYGAGVTDRVGLGGDFHSAKQAVDALISAHKARQR